MGLLTKAVAGVGGKYGINVETLTGDKTLTPNISYIYQFLDEGGADRIITLPTSATAGDYFVIKHNGAGDDTHYLRINQGVAQLDRIYAGAIKEYMFDGTNWRWASLGTGNQYGGQNIAIGDEADATEFGIAIGYSAVAYLDSIAVGTEAKGGMPGVGSPYATALGYSAYAPGRGTAVGYDADGSNLGVAVGYEADGANYGVAVGYQTNTNDNYYSVALGYRSECTRYAELAINIDAEADQENQMMLGGWAGETTDDTPAEIFCGGTANQRFTVRPQSVLSFRIIVNARDDTSGDCATYVFEGSIKRDGAGNTTLCVCNLIYGHEEDATWNCVVSADDANEALIITVTGDADNIVQWDARLDGVETHF